MCLRHKQTTNCLGLRQQMLFATRFGPRTRIFGPIYFGTLWHGNAYHNWLASVLITPNRCTINLCGHCTCFLKTVDTFFQHRLLPSRTDLSAIFIVRRSYSRSTQTEKRKQMSAPSTFPAPAPPSVLEQERRLKSTFRTQAKALFRKNATQQRRALWQNFFIIITPIFFVVLLYVLQRLINNAIQDDPNNKCGCLCLRCCDPSSSADGSGPVCRDATPDAPCNPWEDCQQTDDTRCGIEYSNADQASVCSIPSPSIWPPLFQVPPPDALARPQSPDAAILITGDGGSIVTDMQLFPEPNVTDESIAVAASFTELGQATNAVYAGFPLLGVQMGTSQKSDQLFGFQIEFGFLPNPPEVRSVFFFFFNT
jgi:hypothetical protein